MGTLIGDVASQPYFKSWGCFRGRIGYYPSGGTAPGATVSDNSIEYAAPGFAPNDGLIRFENYKTKTLADLGPMITTDPTSQDLLLGPSIANDDQDSLLGSTVTFDNISQTAVVTSAAYNFTTPPIGQTLPSSSVDILTVSSMTAY